MADPQDELADTDVDRAARAMGRQVLGRDLNADEASALVAIFRASAQALRHGFIRRLAEHVQAEREAESVEELFGDIKPD